MLILLKMIESIDMTLCVISFLVIPCYCYIVFIMAKQEVNLKIERIQFVLVEVWDSLFCSCRFQCSIAATNSHYPFLYEPRSEKTGLRGFRPGPTQTGLYSHRKKARCLKFRI